MSTVIHFLPIDHIRVLNPRSRNAQIFAQLVGSIAAVGLKRPITVTPTFQDENGQWYDLLCGEGRLTACRELGEELIPCHIVEVNHEERYLIGLAENIARRKHSHVELLIAIRILHERGYREMDIARKTGLHNVYIRGVLHLLKEGEIRLIAAVEKGYLPIDVAVSISRAKDKEIQVLLSQLYEQQKLKRSDIIKIRKLIGYRKSSGKSYSQSTKSSTPVSREKLLQMYEVETKRKQLVATQAEFCKQQLLVILSSLNQLFADKNFRTLLRAENIYDMPENLNKCLQHYREGNSNA